MSLTQWESTSTDLSSPAPGFLRLRAKKRDPGFRQAVLLAYEYRCAVCGYDGQLMRETVGIEAAHLRRWAADGPDEVSNALALCSIHHKLLDRGVIGITDRYSVNVSQHFIGRALQLTRSCCLRRQGSAGTAVRTTAAGSAPHLVAHP